MPGARQWELCDVAIEFFVQIMLGMALASAVAVLLFPDRTQGIWQTLACGWLAVVAVDVLLATSGRGLPNEAASWLERWWNPSASRPLNADSAVVSPGIRALLMTSAALALLTCGAFSSTAGLKGRFTGWENTLRRALLPALICIALCDLDLVVVVTAWLLLDMAATGLRDAGQSGHVSRIPLEPGVVGMLRVSSLLLLFATLVASSRYHAVRLDTLLSAIAADGQIDSVVVAGGLAVCLSGAVVCRLGLVPFLSVWKRFPGTAQDRSPMGILLIAVLPALAVVARLTHWSGKSADACALVGALGALTLICVSVMAGVERDRVHVWRLLCAGTACLAAVAISAATPLASDTGLRVVLLQWPVLTGLLLTGEWRTGGGSQKDSGGLESGGRGRWLSLFCLAALLSGCLGVNAVLETVSQAALHASGQLALGLPRDGLLLGIWWMTITGQLLTGFAVVKSLSLTAGESAPCHQKRRVVVRTLAVAIAVAGAVGLPSAVEIPLYPLLPASRWGPHLHVLTFGPATLAVLIGGIFAWLLRQVPGIASRCQITSLNRLAREWFHIDAYIFRLVVLPARVVAWVVAAFDRFLLGGGREDAWIQVAARVSAVVEPLRQGGVYYGLALLATTIGLLLALLHA